MSRGSQTSRPPSTGESSGPGTLLDGIEAATIPKHLGAPTAEEPPFDAASAGRARRDETQDLRQLREKYRLDLPTDLPTGMRLVDSATVSMFADGSEVVGLTWDSPSDERIATIDYAIPRTSDAARLTQLSFQQSTTTIQVITDTVTLQRGGAVAYTYTFLTDGRLEPGSRSKTQVGPVYLLWSADDVHFMLSGRHITVPDLQRMARSMAHQNGQPGFARR